MTSINSGVAVATAAAAMFSAGLLLTSTVQAADGGVKCVGINSCTGQNGCKGQGWTSSKSTKECTDAGGTVSNEAKRHTGWPGAAGRAWLQRCRARPPAWLVGHFGGSPAATPHAHPPAQRSNARLRPRSAHRALR